VARRVTPPSVNGEPASGGDSRELDVERRLASLDLGERGHLVEPEELRDLRVEGYAV
jgi:hypothetical protein